jgi:RNA polymerase sigma-70 factor, ECF subfamily
MAYDPDAGDHELIAAAQRGERAALDQFVRRHEGWVRHVVYATLGNARALDDVVQHVWTNVWHQIGTLVDPQRWRGWLYTMARNAAIDAGQRAARDRRRYVRSDDPDLAVAPEADPAKLLIGEEEHRRILDAIQNLPPIYREPFVLRHVEDWSYAQIGEVMNLPIDTVETRLVRARRLLRTALKDLEAPPKHGDAAREGERDQEPSASNAAKPP